MLATASTTPRRPAALLVAAACLTLGACTAHMEMTISPKDSYDVVLEMRDTTGEVITADTDCANYADPAIIGASEGTKVTSTPIGGAGDKDGLGCLVTVTGVSIPQASEETDGALVVRDGDLYVVTISGLFPEAPPSTAQPADATPAADNAANADNPDNGATPQAGAAPGAPTAGGAEATPTISLNAMVDAHLTITFPGAVVDAGGGTVSGSTVSWDDADVLSDGVSASGYATASRGLSLWDRFGGWIAGAVALVGAAVAWAGIRKRRRRIAAGAAQERRRPWVRRSRRRARGRAESRKRRRRS